MGFKTFEYGEDEAVAKNIYGALYSDEANMHYRYNSLDEITPSELKKILLHFKEHQLKRLDILNKYHMGQNIGILSGKRRLTEDKADYRIAHNYAKLITTFYTAYLTGIPIGVDFEDEKVKEFINTINFDNEIDVLNMDLMTDFSRFGRAYEILYRSDVDKNKTSVSNVFCTLVIYDTSVEMKPLCALRFPTVTVDGKVGTMLTMYTDKEIIEYGFCDLDFSELKEDTRKPHFFGEIPIIEYSHNNYRKGDYEDIITLIDAYDSAVSDTSNYMTDTNDALLAILGDVDADKIQLQKDANAIIIESGRTEDGKQTSVDAKYIHKQYDVQGTEAHKKRLINDIHKLTFTPDLTDENFAGNSSGVAMAWKTFGLKQAIVKKISVFKKGITKRYQLFANLEKKLSRDIGDVTSIKITFYPNIPESIDKEIEVFMSAGGRLSQKTLLETLSFVPNSDEEIKRIEDEQSKSMTLVKKIVREGNE